MLKTPINNSESDEFVSATKAMDILGLSRHRFNKLVESAGIEAQEAKRGKKYRLSDIEAVMASDTFQELVHGSVDARNTLNDLTGKEWLPETKSFFYQKGLGADSPDAQIERQHPAPFSFQDVAKLIRFFTKRGMRVLDPFGGVGSTAKACEVEGRTCTSIELSEKWHGLAIRRLETEICKGSSEHHVFINGDACDELKRLATDSFDFMVTSPPYWGILNKQDQKVKKNRVANNLETNYSDDPKDLGNVESYMEFLDILVNSVFAECARCIRPSRYLAIIVSDFRDKSQFYSFHSDLIQRLDGLEVPDGGTLQLQGTRILLQNHKSLIPYGYPFAYVENIHHQYVLIFKKVASGKKGKTANAS